MKKLYLVIDDRHTAAGEMEAHVYESESEAKDALKDIWESLSKYDQRRRDEVCCMEMQVPDELTADDFNNDLTGDDYYAFDYTAGCVMRYK